MFALPLKDGEDFTTWMGHVLQNVGAPSAEAQEWESTWKEIFRFAGREATATGIEKSFEERESTESI